MHRGMVQMKRMKWMVLLAFGLMVALAGCSSDSSGSENTSSDKTENGSSEEEESVTVSFAYWGSDFDKQRMEAINAEFKKEHPNINVDLIQIPNDGYQQKILTTLAGGEPYDVIQLAENFNSYASKGTLADLSPYIEEDDMDLNRYYQAGIDAYTYQGQVMGMPMRVGPMLLFYNKSLFDENNIDYPDESWTWDDFKNAAQQITDQENNVYGVGKVGHWWASTLSIVRSFGGRMLNEERTQFVMDSPEAKEAVQYISDLIWEWNVSPQPEQFIEGADMWTSGNLGMLIDGPWYILSSQDNIDDFEWDVAPLPKGEQRAAALFATGFSVTEKSEQKRAAWEVVKFWTGQTSQEILASEHGDVPPLKSVANSETYLNLDGMPPENFEAILKATEGAFPPPVNNKWNEMNDALNQSMQGITMQNKPVDEQLQQMKETINSLLSH